MSGKLTEQNSQAIRAASSMVEHLMDRVCGIDSTKLGPLMQSNHMTEKGSGLCSLYTLKFSQMVSSDISYNARIISKDQDGNREITVMNSEMRLGCMMAEAWSTEGGKNVRENLMQSKQKDTILMNMYREAKISKTKSEDPGYVFFDTNDQSRWGPNQLMNMMAHYNIVLCKDPTIRRMLVDTMMLQSKKRNKWPEHLLKLFSKSAGRTMGVDQLVTAYGRAFTEFQKNCNYIHPLRQRVPNGNGSRYPWGHIIDNACRNSKALFQISG
jgi:hypothetical protein